MPEMKTHQLVVRSHGGRINISCQCRASETKHSRDKGGGEYYEPMPKRVEETMWETYNRPENHWVKFLPTDRVKA